MSYTNVVFKQHIARSVNRDEIEQQRINDRIGHQTRFQTAGTLIYKQEPDSTHVVTEAERFNKDHDVNDRIRREQEKERADRFYNARLQKRLERDEDKWNRESDKYLHDEQRRLHQQKVQLANNKNSNGLGYDPIAHHYEESSRGGLLKAKDEGKQINRYVRSKNIVDKNNSNFNIITGQASISQPRIPEKFKQRVQQKYEAKKERQLVRYVPKRDKYDYIDDPV